MTLLRSALIRATALAGFAGWLAAGAPAAAFDYKLTILHVNDLQSRLEPVTETGATCSPEDIQAKRCQGGMARIASRIRSEKATAGNTVVVNTGNAFTGSHFYDTHKTRALSETMKLIDFTAMTVGDREFADGTEMLSRFQEAVRFPLLGANVDVQKDPYMKDRIYPFIATYIGPEQVAVIGYSTENLLQLAKPTGIVRVEPIEVSLRRWLAQLKMMNVNKVVAVSHAGADRDRQIAASIDGLDVIVGSAAGQPASGKGSYPNVLKGPTGQSVLLVQAAEFGRSLGRLDVTFDPKGAPKQWSGRTIELNDPNDEDPAVKAVVQSLATSTASLPAGGTVR